MGNLLKAIFTFIVVVGGLISAHFYYEWKEKRKNRK
jgi:hypothetical protein